MAVRVMFYVQHLLGIGHLRRASLLSAALSAQGMNVLVVRGGRAAVEIPFDPATVVQLPAAHVADHTFTPLLGDGDVPVDDLWKQRRTQKLLEAFHTFKPDILMLEMFPFGRRQFRFELLPLLKAARSLTPRPQIVSSVRDILVNKSKPGRVEETIQLVHDYFDGVLVHGDPALTTLDDTFCEAKAIAAKIHYTGYVAPQISAQPCAAGHGEVIVSAGGGAVGGALFKAALDARPLCKWAALTWRLITGPNYAEDDFQALKREAPNGVIIERYRSDLPHMFKNCVLSISQGGYNTIMDLLRAHATALIVPYAEGAESEQRHRAQLLAHQNVMNLFDAPMLTPSTLAQAINQAQPPPSAPAAIDLSGAQTAARLILEFAHANKAGGLRYGEQ